jgi:hypothetical protein
VATDVTNKDAKPPKGLEEFPIGCLLAINVVAWPLLLWFIGCFDSRPPAKPNQELIEKLADLERKQKDPRVSKCADAAYAFGQKLRREGAMRPGDAELHAIALRACETFGVPLEMRGVAVDKFKSSFGWGWSSER